MRTIPAKTRNGTPKRSDVNVAVGLYSQYYFLIQI